MRRLLLLLTLTAFGRASWGNSSGSGGDTRTVLTDFDYDEVALSYMAYFPVTVPVHPGDTIDFKQAWTGEPHTVTFGTRLESFGNAMKPYLTGAKPAPEDEPAEVAEAGKDLPSFFGEDDLNQTLAQPCYLTTGELPEGKPCPKVEQPEFTGKEVIYNSGFIRYEGNNGNHFKMKLADDIAPGDYFYMCLIHFGPMGGYLQVKPKSEKISSSDISSATRKELDKGNKSAANAHKESLKAKPEGADIQVGGFSAADGFPFAFINEFYPKKFTAKVGQKVTWAMDYHTVSFNVPKYGPQIEIKKDGTVQFNPKAYEPQGGPGYPEQEGPPPEGPPDEDTPPATVDVGNYDGSKFLSSGVPDGSMFYSITFTKAGTYQYACLIHPRMIGTLVVK